jgi:hypothetical protein
MAFPGDTCGKLWRKSYGVLKSAAEVDEFQILRRVRGHSDVEVGKLAEHFTIFAIQSLGKRGIVELGLAVGFAHVAERVQALQDGLAPHRRHLLPTRKQRLPDVSLLLGSHLLPNVLPFAKLLLLVGSQAVPRFEALANLRLLFRRQAQKTRVVPQKLFLPARRHVLQPLDRLGRQFIWIARGWQGIRQLGTHLSLGPLSGTRRSSLLRRGRVGSLRVRGATQKPRRETCG